MSYSAGMLTKHMFGLVMYNLLEYSVEEVYKDTILQGVGGNDGIWIPLKPQQLKQDPPAET
jgi:hypothetical protein